MRVTLLTREYPPEVYGGAGVHVEYLARELRRLVDTEVHCFGSPRGEVDPPARAHAPDPALAAANPALRTMSVDLAMVAGVAGTSLVHSHTWYANFAGHTAKLLYQVPHVMTSHSLEPLRPWKAEQLGGGYALSSFCERVSVESVDAVIAVSEGMRRDVLRCYPAVDESRVHVIHNGIDAEEYRPATETPVLEHYGVSRDAPIVLFVGRITRQKGLPYLLRAARRIDREAQLVLLASAPDTPEILAEVDGLIGELGQARSGVVWVREAVPKPELVQFLSAASVFVCPSIYEPMGIVNLEAMACETPVVATRTGGIPEVVADGKTGVLVPIDPDMDDPYGAPCDAEEFAGGLADAINSLLGQPQQAVQMGRAGRVRAVEQFSWSAIAERTVALYRSLL